MSLLQKVEDVCIGREPMLWCGGTPQVALGSSAGDGGLARQPQLQLQSALAGVTSVTTSEWQWSWQVQAKSEVARWNFETFEKQDSAKSVNDGGLVTATAAAPVCSGRTVSTRAIGDRNLLHDFQNVTASEWQLSCVYLILIYWYSGGKKCILSWTCLLLLNFQTYAEMTVFETCF